MSRTSRGSRGRWLATVAVLLATMLSVPPDPGSANPGGVDVASQGASGSRAAGPPDVLPANESWTVTLITGDVLDVSSDDDGRASVAVRERIGPFQTVREPDAGPTAPAPRSTTAATATTCAAWQVRCSSRWRAAGS